MKGTCEFDNFFPHSRRTGTKWQEKGKLILESDPGVELHAVQVSVYCFPISLLYGEMWKQ